MKKLLLVLLLVLVACAPKEVPRPVVQSMPEPVEVVVSPPVVESVAEVVSPPAAVMKSNAVKTIDAVIEDFAFSPAEIRINLGDTVVWTQKDRVPHTVTVLAGPEAFDSGLLPQGETFSYTFTKPGTYEYKCTPHPRMRGKVIVE